MPYGLWHECLTGSDVGPVASSSPEEGVLTTAWWLVLHPDKHGLALGLSVALLWELFLDLGFLLKNFFEVPLIISSPFLTCVSTEKINGCQNRCQKSKDVGPVSLTRSKLVIFGKSFQLSEPQSPQL